MAGGLQGPVCTSCCISPAAGGAVLLVQGWLHARVLSLVGLGRSLRRGYPPPLVAPLHAVLDGLVWPLQAAPGGPSAIASWFLAERWGFRAGG